MDGNKILNYFKILLYVKGHSPNMVSRKTIADKFCEGNPKVAERYCKTLIDAGIFSSKRGAGGGYTYDPVTSNYLGDPSEFDNQLNGLTYNGVDFLNLVNLSIDDDQVIKWLKTIGFNGLPLITNLKTSSRFINEREARIMNLIVDAIREKHKIKILYISNQFDEATKSFVTYNSTVSPINFTVFNELPYLNAYYQPVKNKMPNGDEVIRRFVISKIRKVEIVDGLTYEINADDFENLKLVYPYEITDKDNLFKFKIKLHSNGYNTFDRAFKNYYHDQIDFLSLYSSIEIETRSYSECVSHLFTLGNTFEFENKENNPIYDLYCKKITEIEHRICGI